MKLSTLFFVVFASLIPLAIPEQAAVQEANDEVSATEERGLRGIHYNIAEIDDSQNDPRVLRPKKGGKKAKKGGGGGRQKAQTATKASKSSAFTAKSAGLFTAKSTKSSKSSGRR